jgi:glycosyltransferase involved in cell wall biosynthesis
MSRTSIGYVVDRFNKGGAQKVIATLANGLDKERFRVVVYCLDEIGLGVSWLNPRVEIRLVGRRPGKPLDLRTVQQLRDFLVSDGIDIVQAHNWSTLLESFAATRANPRAPLIYVEHGGLLSSYPGSRLKRHVRRFIAKSVLNRCTLRVAIAHSLKSRLVSETGLATESIRVITNGIAPPRSSYHSREEARNSLRNQMRVAEDAIVYGTVARLHPVKRLDIALEAFALVANRIPSSRFCIVGEGEQKSELQSLSSHLGIRERVDFVGEQNNVADWLSAFDVYINSSDSEGMSVSILEAMAIGLPIIATDVGDSRLLIGEDSRCGELVPPTSLIEIANAMVRLGCDSSMRRSMSDQGKIRYLDKFSLQEMLEHYDALYQSLLIVRDRG